MAVCCLVLVGYILINLILQLLIQVTLFEFWKKLYCFFWYVTFNRWWRVLTHLVCGLSVLLMKIIYWFNGDCCMTWLWPVGMRGSWVFTMNWTEWHIYQVTVRLFLPSCWMNPRCECLWENSFRFRSPQKERVLTQNIFFVIESVFFNHFDCVCND